LLDLGVETLFKVYLMLPDDIINSKVDYSERCSAVKSGFNRLVQCAKKCAGKKIKDININHVLYFHNIRNKLYHESDSITIPYETARNYASLSVKLLKALIDVDLTERLKDLEIINPKEKLSNEENEQLLNKYVKNNQAEMKAIAQLYNELELCMEKLAPNLLLPSFRKALLEVDFPEAIIAMREICILIEKYFHIDDITEHFLDEDIEFVKSYLKKTSDTVITQYPSKKEIIITVTSGFIGWEGTALKSMPVGNFIVNSLTLEDFFYSNYASFNEDENQNTLIHLFLKIICEIIDFEVSQERFKINDGSLTEITKDCRYVITLDDPEPDNNNRIDAIMYMRDSIREWRNERLELNPT
jgi:hypothetical protein